MKFHGNAIGQSVHEAARWCSTVGWTALQSGSEPLKGRQWVEIQVKGSTALAIAYANKDGTTTSSFTAPADDSRNHQVIPANSIKVIPVGDGVTVYGRAVAKAGNTDGGSKVIVTEFR